MSVGKRAEHSLCSGPKRWSACFEFWRERDLRKKLSGKFAISWAGGRAAVGVVITRVRVGLVE